VIQITTTHSSVEDALEFLHSYKARVALQSSFPPITGVSADEKAVVLSKTQTDAMDDTAGLEPPAKKPAAATARTERTASAEAGAAQEKTADASAQPAGSAEAAPQASTAVTDKPVTYADLQAAVLRLHKTDATAAKPIAESLGFANFKAVPEEKWPEALGLVQAELTKRGV